MATNESLVEQISNSSSRSSENIYKSLCHNYPRDSRIRKKDKRKLMVVSLICLIFMIAEIVGGFLSNSLAIASDAAHLLADFSAFMVSLAAMCIASKPQTQKMSFGFHRAEVIGAFISILSIWLITGVLVYMAVQRLIYPDFEIDSLIMMYVSIGGIVANLVMGIVLVIYKGGNGDILAVEGRESSINVKSAVIHVIGDLLQSVGVFIASLVIYFKPEYKVVDPVCTFIFSVIVLCTTIHILKDIIRVLMEGFPKHLNFADVKARLYSIPGVVTIHNLRIWSLTMDELALSAHIVVGKGKNTTEVLRNASWIIHRDLDIYEVTLQVEEEDDPACAICS